MDITLALSCIIRDTRKGAALRVARRTRPLTNPHPRDARRASYARANFKLRTASVLNLNFGTAGIRRMKFKNLTAVSHKPR